MDVLVRDVGTLVEFTDNKSNMESPGDSNTTRRSQDIFVVSSPYRNRSLNTRILARRKLVGSHHAGCSSGMLSVCEGTYCTVLISLSLSLPLFSLIMYARENMTNALNIAHGYFIFLFLSGIMLQFVFLLRKLYESCGTSTGSTTSTQSSVQMSVGDTLWRAATAMFGVLCCASFLLLFAWRLDQNYTLRNAMVTDCPDLRIDIAVLALSLIYALPHIYILFFNVKLVVQGTEPYVVAGLLHILATDVGSWSWTAMYYIPIIFNTNNQTSGEHCGKLSSLSSMVYYSAPYLVLVTLIFYLLAIKLVLSFLFHFAQKGTFANHPNPEKPPSGAFQLAAQWPGAFLALLVVVGGTVITAYHVTFIRSGQTSEAWLLMESTAVSLSGLTLLVCCFLIRQEFSNAGVSILKSIQGWMVTKDGPILLGVCLLGIIAYNASFTLASLRSNDPVGFVAATASILEMVEVCVLSIVMLGFQSFLLVPQTGCAVWTAQSAALFLCVHNLVLVLLSFLRQQSNVYGEIFRQGFGGWFDAFARTVLSGFVVAFRLGSHLLSAKFWYFMSTHAE